MTPKIIVREIFPGSAAFQLYSLDIYSFYILPEPLNKEIFIFRFQLKLPYFLYNKPVTTLKQCLNLNEKAGLNSKIHGKIIKLCICLSTIEIRIKIVLI